MQALSICKLQALPFQQSCNSVFCGFNFKFFLCNALLGRLIHPHSSCAPLRPHLHFSTLHLSPTHRLPHSIPHTIPIALYSNLPYLHTLPYPVHLPYTLLRYSHTPRLTYAPLHSSPSSITQSSLCQWYFNAVPYIIQRFCA